MGLRYKIKSILPSVSKPARYLGNEWNAVHKDPADVKVNFVLAFPDLYEIGMSHLGFKILYAVINRQDGFAAERVFAPAVDMEEKMRRFSVPLFSLESCTPLRLFDFVGFTLQHELSYTNILNMLDLAGIPRMQSERTEADPLVLGGGPGAFNPEPVAAFFDAFVLGDGENIVLKLMHLYESWRSEKKRDRRELLVAIASNPGVYIPSFYQDHYDSGGSFAGLEALHPSAPALISKQVCALSVDDYPTSPVVPHINAVHDRAILELFRGCTKGCRFCQAGIIYRPLRERGVDELRKLAENLLKETGYEEISLSSLSSGDYSEIESLVCELLDCFKEDNINLSLPSLRLDSFSVQLAKKIQKVRRSGLTFAPEAGTQRLRDVINKNITGKDLVTAASDAFEAGWDNLKLYFMIGLPTETEADLDGIVGLTEEVIDLYRKKKRDKGRRFRLSLSISAFVPKAHTPFQWESQITREEIYSRQRILINQLRRNRAIHFSCSDPEMAVLEAVFAKGDRRLSSVISTALDSGCRFDSWGEHFYFDRWQKAFASSNIAPGFYAHRKIPIDAPLPWDHLESGVSKDFLLREYQKALRCELTSDCREGCCHDCGLQECFMMKKAASNC